MNQEQRSVIRLGLSHDDATATPAMGALCHASTYHFGTLYIRNCASADQADIKSSFSIPRRLRSATHLGPNHPPAALAGFDNFVSAAVATGTGNLIGGGPDFGSA